MSYYYGLTIGPIYTTLSSVRATRELWGASYLFSHFMELILKKLVKIPDVQVLQPVLDLPEEAQNIGTGLFPDRLMAKGQEDSGKHIVSAIHEAIEDLGVKIAQDLPESETSLVKDVQAFLRDYLQTYLVRVQPTSDQVPVQELIDLMNATELRPPFQQEVIEGRQYLSVFFDLINQSELKKQAFGFDAPDIDTLIEIGTKELRQPEFTDSKCQEDYNSIQNDWRENQKKYLWFKGQAQRAADLEKKKLLEQKAKKAQPAELLSLLIPKPNIYSHLKNYHKYVAIIYADGDNISSTVKALDPTVNAYQNFASSLLEFGVEAVSKIRAFGGLPVYIGGDDLLFFTPVMHLGKTVFHLVEELDELFKEFITVTNEKKKPSLSFGVSISFHKFPLYEALHRANDLLDEKAKCFPLKKVPETDQEKSWVHKNAVAFQMLKHSGQEFGQVLSISKGRCFSTFKKLLDEQLNNSGRLLSSVGYMIGKNERLLDLIGNDEHKLKYFFTENFNEQIHQEEGKAYLDLVRDLIHSAYQDADTLMPEEIPSDLLQVNKGEYARQTIYGLLRTLHFLTQEFYD